MQIKGKERRKCQKANMACDLKKKNMSFNKLYINFDKDLKEQGMNSTAHNPLTMPFPPCINIIASKTVETKL